jgi:hypothetical protein
MKPLILISLITAAFFASATALLVVCGVRIHLSDPLTAGAIAIGAGVIGIIPIIVSTRKDAVGVFQLALAGTVLHLVGAVALTVAAMLTHLASAKLDFMYWLLAGYWVSLVLLLWQLRRRLLATIEIAKTSSDLKSATL